MKPFDVNETGGELRDANDKRIEILPVPSGDMLDRLTVQTISGADMERVRLISNFNDEIEEEDEGWKYSDAPAKATKLTIEKIMVELAGESWFGDEREDGYSAGEIIDMLSRRAFVQLSELTAANIRACLDNGGKVIAYFPDLVWREYFDQPASLPAEVPGMRAVEIESMAGDGGIVINDLSSAGGKGKRLDMATFAWLAKDGWMLEVYK